MGQRSFLILGALLTTASVSGVLRLAGSDDAAEMGAFTPTRTLEASRSVGDLEPVSSGRLRKVGADEDRLAEIDYGSFERDTGQNARTARGYVHYAALESGGPGPRRVEVAAPAQSRQHAALPSSVSSGPVSVMPDWAKPDAGPDTRPAGPPAAHRAVMGDAPTRTEVAMGPDGLRGVPKRATAMDAVGALPDDPAPVAAPSPAPAAAPSRGDRPYAVHLASYHELDRAERGWVTLKRSHGDILAGLEAEGVRVTIPGKGPYVRLLAGEFTTAREAASFCAALKARSVYCHPATATGALVGG